MALVVAALALSPAPQSAQTAGALLVRPLAEAYFPQDTYKNAVTGVTSQLYSSLGFGGGAALDYTLKPWLVPFVRFDYFDIPYPGGDAMTGSEALLGIGLALRPLDRLGLRLDAMGGVASLSAVEENGSSFSYGSRLSLTYRLSPSLSLSAGGGYSALRGSSAPILSAFAAGLAFSYDLSALGEVKPKVSIEEPKLDAVFPSLYAYYDDNAFGTVKVVNREDAAIEDVRVSFYASRYMDQPKICADYPEQARGQAVEVPLKALFSDSVLQITQGIDAKGEIRVDYTYLGAARHARAPIDFRVHHRNAITWSDDRRAASFVSPTNPAALWFAKFASGVVRDRMRTDINKPLQYAVGMFEAERLYGLNYVVVPANDYSVKHGLKDYIDSVQFPHQTLTNRGGDCSDLAILFSSLMQSVGVDTAFITIPGHIFAAFDTGLDEEEAQGQFYDPGLLVYREGRAWIPVEITMVKEGFNKAWRIGAKEWYDNVKRGSAAFYRVPDCWRTYPPAAFPGVNPRFTLPSEIDEALAFDAALDRYVAREMGPRIDDLRTELASERPEVRSNEIGVLYARYGLLKDSWRELSDSAKEGCLAAWTNLGNVAYLRKDFKLALSYYEYVAKRDPSDDGALLGVARCQYELENFDASDAAYAELGGRNRALASRFGYLGSIFGGEGRAWSLSERYSSTRWASALEAKKVIAEVAAAPEAGAAKDQRTAGVPAVSGKESSPATTDDGPDAASAEATRSSALPDKPALIGELPTDAELEAAVAEATARARYAVEEAKKAETASSPPPRASAEVAVEPPAEVAVEPPVEAGAPPAEVAVEPSAEVGAPSAEVAVKLPAEAVEPSAEAPLAAESAPKQAGGLPTKVASSVEASAPMAEAVAPTPAPGTPEAVADVPAGGREAGPATARDWLRGARIVLGAWVLEPDRAVQTDESSFFAKLAVPLAQSAALAYRYSFVARSSALGRGWVGLGAHLFVPRIEGLTGYGSGDSLLVWLTRDPVHFSNDQTRIQLYRSYNGWDMRLIVETAVPESIYDSNRFDISVDPKSGTVAVSLNGNKRLEATGIARLPEGRYVVLRALDTAEFSAFDAEAER